MKRILIALAALLLPSMALAQSALLQGGPITPGHAPMYIGAGGQTVVQDSGPAGGGAAGLGMSEGLFVARGTGAPPYAGQGTGPYGTNICDYDAPKTNPNGYHYLCASANAQGGGLIAFGAAGPAARLPLNFAINGSFYGFPGNGMGNVLGPNTSTIGHIPLWNNNTGSLLDDSGQLLVSILSFGGVADSSSAYNSTNAATNATALANGLATGSCVSLPFNASGYSVLAESITIGTGGCLIGENQVMLKSQPGAGNWVLHVTSAETVSGPAIIQNVHLDTTGAGSGSSAIRFATASADVSGAQISQILCTNAYQCVGDETSAGNYVFDIKLYDIRATKTLGPQFKISRSRGFMWLDTMRVDQTAQTVSNVPGAAGTWNDFEFDDYIGLELNRIDSVGPVTTTYESGHTCLVLQGNGGYATSAWLNRILCDSTNGNGPIISADFLQANWVESFANLGNQIEFVGLEYSNVSNILVQGAVGRSGAAGGANGVTCAACTYNAFVNVNTALNTGSGFVFDTVSGAPTNNNVVTGLISSQNTDAGYLLNPSNAATLSDVTTTGYQGIGNGTGLLVTAGSNLLFNGGQLSGNTSPVNCSPCGTPSNNIVIQSLLGYNPIGPSNHTVGTSPATICAGASADDIYLTQGSPYGATVYDATATYELAQLVTANTLYPVHREANQCVIVTWATTAPTYNQYIH